ncbi:hypothetical protein [Nostoc sp.]
MQIYRFLGKLRIYCIKTSDRYITHQWVKQQKLLADMKKYTRFCQKY